MRNYLLLLLITVFSVFTACETDEIFDLNEQIIALEAKVDDEVDRLDQVDADNFAALQATIDAVVAAQAQINNQVQNQIAQEIADREAGDVAVAEEAAEARRILSTEIREEILEVVEAQRTVNELLAEAIDDEAAARLAGDDALADDLNEAYTTLARQDSILAVNINRNSSSISSLSSHVRSVQIDLQNQITSNTESITALYSDVEGNFNAISDLASTTLNVIQPQLTLNTQSLVDINNDIKAAAQSISDIVSSSLSSLTLEASLSLLASETLANTEALEEGVGLDEDALQQILSEDYGVEKILKLTTPAINAEDEGNFRIVNTPVDVTINAGSAVPSEWVSANEFAFQSHDDDLTPNTIVELSYTLGIEEGSVQTSVSTATTLATASTSTVTIGEWVFELKNYNDGKSKFILNVSEIGSKDLEFNMPSVKDKVAFGVNSSEKNVQDLDIWNWNGNFDDYGDGAKPDGKYGYNYKKGGTYSTDLSANTSYSSADGIQYRMVRDGNYGFEKQTLKTVQIIKYTIGDNSYSQLVSVHNVAVKLEGDGEGWIVNAKKGREDNPTYSFVNFEIVETGTGDFEIQSVRNLIVPFTSSYETNSDDDGVVVKKDQSNSGTFLAAYGNEVSLGGAPNEIRFRVYLGDEDAAHTDQTPISNDAEYTIYYTIDDVEYTETIALSQNDTYFNLGKWRMYMTSVDSGNNRLVTINPQYLNIPEEVSGVDEDTYAIEVTDIKITDNKLEVADIELSFPIGPVSEGKSAGTVSTTIKVNNLQSDYDVVFELPSNFRVADPLTNSELSDSDFSSLHGFVYDWSTLVAGDDSFGLTLKLGDNFDFEDKKLPSVTTFTSSSVIEMLTETKVTINFSIASSTATATLVLDVNSWNTSNHGGSGTYFSNGEWYKTLLLPDGYEFTSDNVYPTENTLIGSGVTFINGTDNNNTRMSLDFTLGSDFVHGTDLTLSSDLLNSITQVDPCGFAATDIDATLSIDKVISGFDSSNDSYTGPIMPNYQDNSDQRMVVMQISTGYSAQSSNTYTHELTFESYMYVNETFSKYTWTIPADTKYVVYVANSTAWEGNATHNLGIRNHIIAEVDGITDMTDANTFIVSADDTNAWSSIGFTYTATDSSCSLSDTSDKVEWQDISDTSKYFSLKP